MTYTRPKILATSWHPGGINSIIPVIKLLTDEGKIDIVTVGHQYSEKILAEKGIKYKTIKDYGLNNVSLESMDLLLQKEFPDLILTGQGCQDENNPAVIEQSLILAGKNRNIFTISVSDFWTDRVVYYSEIFSPAGKFKFLSDHITVIDDFQKNLLIKEGFPENILVVTGNPHFDDLESKARTFTVKEKNELREQIGLDQELLLFYAANVFKKEKDRFGFWDLDNIKLVNDVLRELPDKKHKKCGLVVKLHPRVPTEDSEDIQKYLNTETESKIKLISDIHPHKLILASDITLTSFSTVGIESVYMGKPCISIQPNLKCEDLLSIITQNNIIPVGYKTEECKSLVKRAILDDVYREKGLIEKAASFRTDGKATERVANLIYEVLGRGI